MVKSVQSYRDGFKYCLDVADKENVPPLPLDISNLIRSEIMDDVAYLASLTGPIADVIAALEAKNAHVGQVWEAFIKLHSFYKQKKSDSRLLPKIYKTMIDRMIDRLNARAKESIQYIW